MREIVYRWGRNEHGRLAYHLWMVKPIDGADDEFAYERV